MNLFRPHFAFFLAIFLLFHSCGEEQNDAAKEQEETSVRGPKEASHSVITFRLELENVLVHNSNWPEDTNVRRAVAAAITTMRSPDNRESFPEVMKQSLKEVGKGYQEESVGDDVLEYFFRNQGGGQWPISSVPEGHPLAHLLPSGSLMDVYQGESQDIGEWLEELVTEAKNQAMEVMRHRLDRAEVPYRSMQLAGWDEIQLGVPREKRDFVIRLLGRSAEVRFYETVQFEEMDFLSELIPKNFENPDEGEPGEDGEEREEAAHPADGLFELMVEEPNHIQVGYCYMLEVALQDTGAANAILRKREVARRIPRDVHLAWQMNSEEGRRALLVVLRDKYLSGTFIAEAEADFDQQTSAPNVMLRFDREGSGKWARMTRDNIGRQIAIWVDGEVVSAPTVQSEITQGRAMISGNFTLEEARQLASQIESGPMAARLTVMEYEDE